MTTYTATIVEDDNGWTVELPGVGGVHVDDLRFAEHELASMIAPDGNFGEQRTITQSVRLVDAEGVPVHAFVVFFGYGPAQAYAAVKKDPPAGCRWFRDDYPGLYCLRRGDTVFEAIAEVTAQLRHRHGINVDMGIDKPDEWDGNPERVAHLLLMAINRAEFSGVTPDQIRAFIDTLLAPAPVPETSWDAESFNNLRSGRETLFLLASMPMEPVLQHTGQALLAELAKHTPGAEPYAAHCAEQLQARSREGDDQLALELRHALGQPVSAGEHGMPAWPLEPVSVDLAELADHLEGDPLQGRGVLDLKTGMVWPAGITDYDPPPELDETDGRYDPDRWLYFSPDSHEGYRDMLDFTDHVTDERLRTRLLDALDGRGAFRRFRDIVHAEPEAVLTLWTIFSAERTLGRARAWLADHGYRSAA
jgi:hypothetical protein